MKIILENTETGELKEIIDKGKFKRPWRIKEVIPDPPGTNTHDKQLQAELAVWATKLKLPVATFLDAARWLLNKDCPFCQLGTQVLKRIKELGDERAISTLQRILQAKETTDYAALEQIKRELNG